MKHLIVLAALAALGLLSASLFVVDQRQFAVVYALGEIRQVIDKPGLHFKLPPPFQNVQYFDKRILTIDNPDIDRFITSEKLNVQIDTYVKWRITEPKSFIRSVSGSEVIAADRISRSLRDALNNEIAKRTVAEVISGNRDQIMAGGEAGSTVHADMLPPEIGAIAPAVLKGDRGSEIWFQPFVGARAEHALQFAAAQRIRRAAECQIGHAHMD